MDPARNPVLWLRASGASRDVIDGLERFTDWSSLWNECPRGDWLLGIATRLGAPHLALVHAAIKCARIADHVGDHVVGDGSLRVLSLAEEWTEGRASIDDIKHASAALEKNMSQAFDRGAEAAARSALAVGLGIIDRDLLVVAASAAAESVMLSTIDCGLELAMRWAHDKCAAAVRDAVPLNMVETCIERLEGAG